MVNRSRGGVRPGRERSDRRIGEVGGEEEEQVEAEGEESDKGERKPTRMNEPRQPSEAERVEHEMTHLPYRNWCRHCVKGRGKEAAHRRKEEAGDLHEVHFDFAFMGDEKEAGNTVTILVARERQTRMTLATVVPAKSTGKFVVERVWAFMKEMGIEHLDIIAKSDQEPSIKKLVEEVGRRKAEAGGRWIPENSPVGSHASNGVVERGIQSVEGQVRVLKDCLEEKWGLKIEAKHMIVPWIVEYAAHLLNRFEVGHDGRTAYERCKGKTAKSMGIEFGEAVLWRKRPARGALGKLTVLWKDGVYLGVKGKTGEFIVGDEQGVWKTRTLQRKPIGSRWDPKNAVLVSGVPWNTGEADDEADGDKMEVIRLEPNALEERPKEREMFGDVLIPRRAKIGKKDLLQHGYTARCEGCRAALADRPARPHSEECRNRMEKLMKDDPKMQAAKRRMDDFFEKVAEEHERGEKTPEGGDGEEAGAKRTRGGASSSGASQPAQGSGMSEEERKRSREVSAESTSPENAKARKEGEKRGTKRSSEEVEQEPEAMEVMEAETNDEPNEVNDWDDYWDTEEYADQRTGEPLDPAMARAARMEEIAYMKKIGLFDEVPLEECWEKTGKAPTSTKWVDVNKGTADRPEIRCRLVARDFKPRGEKDREDLFAAMPPLECKKLLFKKAFADNARRRREGKKGVKLMFIDVRKAHLYGEVPDDVYAYIELPGEAGKQGRCGRLKKWLYGMRPAAGAWEKHFSTRLGQMGFVKGRAAPTVFYNREREARCVVHGDDFTFSGEAEVLGEIEKAMKDTYELKVRGVMGDEPHDDKQIVILNRTLAWKEDRLEYKPDSKHVQEILKYFDLDETSKGLDVAIVKDAEVAKDERDYELHGKVATEFRALAARANYLSLDRPDIQFATKEICRSMARPTASGMAKMKRLARYLLQHPQATIEYDGRGEGGIQVYTDSDWAGCRKSRRSTSGGIMLVDGGCVKNWSSTQATIAQSSGEAEYYAVVRAAAEALGMKSIMMDLGWHADIRLWIDSSAAKSIASRVGLGKVRHMEVKFLWLQEVVKDKRVALRKIAGSRNPGDVLTKPKSFSENVDLLRSVGIEVGSRSARKEVGAVCGCAQPC